MLESITNIVNFMGQNTDDVFLHKRFADDEESSKNLLDWSSSSSGLGPKEQRQLQVIQRKEIILLRTF